MSREEFFVCKFGIQSMKRGFLFEGPWICNDYAWHCLAKVFFLPKKITNDEKSEKIKDIFLYSAFLQELALLCS